MIKENVDHTFQTWLQWMEWGAKTGCHQKPERSFFIKGYQMPVCARCFGVIIGYIIAIPSFFIIGFSKIVSLAGCIGMFLDWLLQYTNKLESTNKRRLITGIMGGYGIITLQLYMIKKAFTFCKSLMKNK
jgi:uncharacterized membrane protein